MITFSLLFFVPLAVIPNTSIVPRPGCVTVDIVRAALPWPWCGFDLRFNFKVSLYRFESSTHTYTYSCIRKYQNWHTGCHLRIWSKINFSHKVRYQIKAEVIIFPLHYWTGADSTSLLRSSGGKLSKVESLVDFGWLSSLPKICPSLNRLWYVRAKRAVSRTEPGETCQISSPRSWISHTSLESTKQGFYLAGT